jgi:hypothetical protein
MEWPEPGRARHSHEAVDVKGGMLVLQSGLKYECRSTAQGGGGEDDTTLYLVILVQGENLVGHFDPGLVPQFCEHRLVVGFAPLVACHEGVPVVVEM